MLLPGNQLSLARASWASGADQAGCRHGTCLQHHRLTAHFFNSRSFVYRSANTITCALSGLPLLVTLRSKAAERMRQASQNESLNGALWCPEVEDRASTLDVVCIVAAACDLAIADSGFRTAVNATGEFVVETLFEMYHKARTRFPRDVPGREGLLSLMLFQLSRVLTACAVGAHPALHSSFDCSGGACSRCHVTVDLALPVSSQCFRLLNLCRAVTHMATSRNS